MGWPSDARATERDGRATLQRIPELVADLPAGGEEFGEDQPTLWGPVRCRCSAQKPRDSKTPELEQIH